MPVKGVFIIESLDKADEQQKRREGKLLTEMLNLCGIASEYRYIRTKKELKEMIKQFVDCDYRFLHISCHGNDEALGLTLDYIEFAQLNELFEVSGMTQRRLFLSSCNVCNDDLTTSLQESGFLSIIGPREDIGFSNAAIYWASFYHFMFGNKKKLDTDEMKGVLRKVSKFFEVKMRAYIRKKNGAGYNRYEY